MLRGVGRSVGPKNPPLHRFNEKLLVTECSTGSGDPASVMLSEVEAGHRASEAWEVQISPGSQIAAVVLQLVAGE